MKDKAMVSQVIMIIAASVILYFEFGFWKALASFFLAIALMPKDIHFHYHS